MLLYLCQLELVSNKKHLPLLLIDDAFVEVDDINKKKIIDLFSISFQIIYVTTQKNEKNLFENPQCFYLEQGVLCKN